MKKIAGIVIIFASFILLMTITLNWEMWWLGQFLDLPAVIWLLFSAWGVTLITGEGRTFIVAINALISKKYVLPEATRDKAVRLFKLLSKVIYGSAFVAVTSQAMFILLTLDDPGVLGPMLSVVLLSLFYATFINFAFVHPAVYLLENRRNTEEKILISERQIIDKLLELCYRQGITPEEIIGAEEIAFHKQDS